MRKFQIISGCGRRGVKEDGAEGGWGDGGLEFNESNIGISEVRSQASKATEASVPLDLKTPRQLKLATWKKASDNWQLMRLASSEAETEELTGTLDAYAAC